MWIINSDNTVATNSDSLTSLRVLPVDVDMNTLMLDEDDIVGYCIFNGVSILAGPYVSETTAINQMLTLVSEIGRKDIFYFLQGDYKNESNKQN